MPEDVLNRVLQAARWAPSWANKQCCRYIVVDDPAVMPNIVSGLAKSFGAPMFIVACADPAESGHKNGMDYYLVDVAISLEHLVLAAASEGLGTCWLGGMIDEASVKKQLSIPDSMKVVAITPLGYPEESLTVDVIRERVHGDSRKPLEDIVFKNKYGERLK